MAFHLPVCILCSSQFLPSTTKTQNETCGICNKEQCMNAFVKLSENDKAMLKADYGNLQKQYFDAECRFLFISKMMRRKAQIEPVVEISSVVDMEID